MYGLMPDMTSYLKESLSVSIGCYGPTLMHRLNMLLVDKFAVQAYSD